MFNINNFEKDKIIKILRGTVGEPQAKTQKDDKDKLVAEYLAGWVRIREVDARDIELISAKIRIPLDLQFKDRGLLMPHKVQVGVDGIDKATIKIRMPKDELLFLM